MCTYEVDERDAERRDGGHAMVSDILEYWFGVLNLLL